MRAHEFLIEYDNPEEDAKYFLVGNHYRKGPFNTKDEAHDEYDFLCDVDPKGMASSHLRIVDQFGNEIEDLNPQLLADKPRWGLRENDDVVAVIDGVRSDRKFNDYDHARNAMSKLISYGRAKHAEVYVNGKKKYNLELNKRHDDFEPKTLDDMNESHGYHFGFQGEEVPRGLDATN